MKKKIEIEIVHIRSGVEGEFIGRPSVLGNKFYIGRDGSRDEVIEKYKVWLYEKIEIKDEMVMKELNRLMNIVKRKKLVLVCYCAPLRCHGDIIKEYLISMRGE